MANYAGLAYLGLIGAAFTYLLWFRGLSRLEPSAVAPLGFLSPVVAILLGWGVLDERLTPVQALGILVVLISVWLSQRAQLAPRVRPARA
jgi:probable blue pigment (indigoidine) exporter